MRSFVACVAAIACASPSIGCTTGGVARAVGPLDIDAPGHPAKCRVSASTSSPLVTEWSASEKARLEALVRRGPVAVAYEGCDLRIVEGCRPAGAYAFARTTLATDTIEIATEDDLYSKLPLGAISLEGELRRSGRLAVRTTVVGQFRLGEVPRVEGGGACAEATHVVQALSVGAFKLLSGGAASASAKVDARAVQGGASAETNESVLREAGLREQCESTPPEKPHIECASPVQIFLAPIARDEAGDAREVALPDSEHVPDDAVLMDFEPPEPAEPWSLRTKHERLVCTLPCVRFIGPKSKLVLWRESTDGPTARVDVPDDVGYSPGRMVIATPRPERGVLTHVPWFPLAGAGAVSVLAGAAEMIAFHCGVGFTGHHEVVDGKDRTTSCILGNYFLFVGVPLLVGGVALGLWAQPAELQTRLAPPGAHARSTFRLLPNGFAF